MLWSHRMHSLRLLWCGTFFFFQAEDGIRDFLNVTGVQTCALPIDRKSTRLNSSHIQKSLCRLLLVTGVQTCALPIDRKSTRLNSSHIQKCRMPSSAGRKHRASDGGADRRRGHLRRRAPVHGQARRRRGHPRRPDPLHFFFFKDPPPPDTYTNLNTLSLHDALPI